MFDMLCKCSDCLHLACHSHSCSKSWDRVGRSSKSCKITTTAHLLNISFEIYACIHILLNIIRHMITLTKLN